MLSKKSFMKTAKAIELQDHRLNFSTSPPPGFMPRASIPAVWWTNTSAWTFSVRTLPASVCFISKCQELESPFTDLFIHSCSHISVTFTYFPFSKRPRIIVVSHHVILQIFEIITFWFVYWLGSHLNTSDSCKLYHRMSWKNVSVTYCHVKNTPKFSALKEWHYLFCSHICLGGLSGNSSEGGGRFAGLAVNAGLCCQCHQPSTYMCPLHMTWVPGLVTSDSEPSGSFITS